MKTETGPARAAVLRPEETGDGEVIACRSTELPGDQSAVFAARVWTRTTTTALCWNGDVLRAVEVVSRLVDNGVRHGVPADTPLGKRRLSLSAAITDAGALIVEVSDLNPAFPDFDVAVRGERGRGLWQVAHRGAQVTWFLQSAGGGKTVRAVLQPM
ncbi:Anti-sigma regulatory factor (Ser/Thr protein kinase) [Streptomyces sp. Ag109_G2-15]|nr:Anti-sigma regulatory factor (Ser/Thr protein kinase) [Streptomyces sp. Ag109_G2-15]